ncbi:ABC transporter permease [Pantoea agglomerans]|uniref:ABC transporter permease n=1 Tax=Enterobacter agglomerans TaxID=549 RepID=UPI003D272C4D
MRYSIGYLFELVLVITGKEIKIRYKNNIFGYLWSLANPLCFAFIYYVAFKVVMKVPVENYTLFLLCGLFPWQWFANSLIMGMGGFLSNAQIIKKTAFPRFVIPFSTVLMECFHFIFAIPVIFIFLHIYGFSPDWIWLAGVPIIGLAQILLSFGLAILFATINLFFRDIERFVSLAIMMLFYATPILYSVDLVPKEYLWVFNANPLSSMILSWRDLFMHNNLNWGYIGNFYISSLICVFLGMWTYNKLKDRFAEVL